MAAAANAAGEEQFVLTLNFDIVCCWIAAVLKAVLKRNNLYFLISCAHETTEWL